MPPLRLLVMAGFAWLMPQLALAIDIKGDLVQGGLAIGQAQPGDRIALDGQEIKVAPDGLFVIGFGRDAPAEHKLTIIQPDGKSNEQTLSVRARQFDVQRIDHLEQNQVTPDPATQARIVAEIDQVRDARKAASNDRDFLTPFIWPARGPISGVYGSQRILNGTPKSPHFGVDIAAAEGSPVIAPAGGIVTLSALDMVLMGNVVVLDHGFGVFSTFIHLHDVAVKPGQRIAQGELIGHVGKTGRATGPHLHWALNWLGVPLDAALLVPPMAPLAQQ
jgi:murein DD-endopeptidase MepM/ murein hydrolase activator NlpD